MEDPVAAAPASAPAAAAPAKASKKASSKPKNKKPANHPKYSDMIKAAITNLKERGGSSRQAILKYIVGNYNVGTDEKTINSHLKMALRAGAKNGNLKQSKGTGASGSFKLGSSESAKPASPKKTSKPKAAKPKSPAKAKKPKVKKPAATKKAAAAKKPKSPKKAAAKKPKTPKPAGAAKPKKSKKPKEKAAKK